MPSTPSAGELVKTMLAAAQGSLDKDWPKARDYAKPELSKLARSLLDIGNLFAAGKITELEARSLLEIHKNTTKMVFLTVEGLGLLAVEKAINAALGAVKDSVNGALGFALL
jgi:hypothetical protein